MNLPWDKVYEALGILPPSSEDDENVVGNNREISSPTVRNKQHGYNQALKKFLREQEENFHVADVLLGRAPQFVPQYFPGTKFFHRRVRAYSGLYGALDDSKTMDAKNPKKSHSDPILSMEDYADQLMESVWKSGGRFFCLSGRDMSSVNPVTPGVQVMHIAMARQMTLDALARGLGNQGKVRRRRMIKHKHGTPGKKARSAIKAAAGGAKKVKLDKASNTRSRSKKIGSGDASVRHVVTQKRKDSIEADSGSKNEI